MPFKQHPSNPYKVIYEPREYDLPKREWVGLTDEEIDDLVKNTQWHELIKATEAKLKERNT